LRGHLPPRELRQKVTVAPGDLENFTEMIHEN
jgi:hypothetical protein